MSAVSRPVRPPSSSATRTITPTPCSSQAGNSSSSGDWSKTLKITCTASTTPLRTNSTAVCGSWSLTDTPNRPIRPSCFNRPTVSSQSPRPSHSSCQTWNCTRSNRSSPLTRSEVCTLSRMCAPGKVSAGSTPARAGHCRFSGGTLVATRTCCPAAARSRTTCPTSRSLSP